MPENYLERIWVEIIKVDAPIREHKMSDIAQIKGF
jgi:hypothetical protein